MKEMLLAKIAELTKMVEDLDSKPTQQIEQGMTWERAFEIVKPKYYVNQNGDIGCDSRPYILASQLNVTTEADSKAVIAFCKLKVIAAACNLRKEKGDIRYSVECFNAELADEDNRMKKSPIEFYDKADRDQSKITNRQLWLDLHNINNSHE